MKKVAWRGDELFGVTSAWPEPGMQFRMELEPERSRSRILYFYAGAGVEPE